MTPHKLFLLLVPLALAGHGYLATASWCRLNGLGLKRQIAKPLSFLLMLVTVGLPIACAAAWYVTPNGALPGEQDLPWYARYAGLYAFSAAGVGLVGIPLWLFQRISGAPPSVLTEKRSEVVDIGVRLGRLPVSGWEANLLARAPGNQLMELEINQKTLALSGLPQRLAGLKLLHLSDLHMEGRLEADFFQEIVLLANQTQPDIVCVTGDIIDKRQCLGWLSDILGELAARYGVYYILGNHDERIGDMSLIHNELQSRGWTHLGSRWRTILIEGEELLMAGNERPWMGSAPDLTNAPAREGDGGMFRLLLAHTPDLYPWAKKHTFDLMLAGHNHGGQIHAPFLGPIVSPSVYGVKYSSGLFHEGPTVLHVSQGTGSYFPYRFGCRQELTLLTLTPSSATDLRPAFGASSAKGR